VGGSADVRPSAKHEESFLPEEAAIVFQESTFGCDVAKINRAAILEEW
jgi:hypothetical protein